MDCCYLVGNLGVNLDYVTSIQMQSSTEASKIEGEIIVGPTIGTLSLTGYGSLNMHTGCPGKAGVTIDWIRKYDCDTDTIYLIFAGAGRSYVAGFIPPWLEVEIVEVLPGVESYQTFNASSLNGPTSLYEYTKQLDGFGLKYGGKPFRFDSSELKPAELFIYDRMSQAILVMSAYLQSFTLQCTPGSLPVASYNFIYTFGNLIVG